MIVTAVCDQCNGLWEMLSRVMCNSLWCESQYDGEATSCGSWTEGHKLDL